MTKDAQPAPFGRRLAAFWNPSLPSGAAADFKLRIVRRNLSRLRLFSFSLVFLTPFMAAVDYLAVQGLDPEKEALFWPLLTIHLLLFSGALFMIARLNRKNWPEGEAGPGARSGLELAAVAFLLLLTAIFTGLIQPLGSGVGAYLLVVFVTVSFIVQNAVRSSLLLSLSLAVLIAMILFLNQDPVQMRVDIINSVGATLGAIFVSQILYRTSVKEFINDQLITKQKNQVERVNQRLYDSNERLLRISFLDPLTEIANRRYLDEYLGREWKRAVREGQELALIMADIDHFKAFNDIYGHRAGDECLIQVASALEKSLLRGPDMVARYGGEEFAVVLPRTDLRGALELAERMRRAVAELGLGHKGNEPGVVTISLGAAVIRPAHEQAPEILVEAADKQLYKAKEGGRNRVRPEPDRASLKSAAKRS